MDTPIDFLDMVRCLLEAECEFVVVGAYALARNGVPRATQDIDLLVRPNAENAHRLMAALAEFGAPISAHGVSADDFTAPGSVYQIGLPPTRIDILTSIAGVTFEEAKQESVAGKLGELTVRFLGPETQIRNKRASGRPKDLVDADALEAVLRQP